MLSARVEGIYSQLSDNAAIRSTEAQRAKVETQLTADMSNVFATSGDIETKFKTADGIIEDYAPALTPEEETAYRATARKQIVLNEFQTLLSRGDMMGAKELYEDSPQIASMLGPEEQRAVSGRIASMIQKQKEVANAGRRKVEELTQILGRPPTMDERVRAAGVSAPDGKLTPAEKIAGIEEALGRSLTSLEKANALDVDGGAPLTDAGKNIVDRERFVSQFGEGSPQVAAFDDAMSGGSADLSDEAGIRKEFTKLSDDFVKVRDAYSKIVSASESGTGPGDMSMVFNYMKMLDPGSTVREGEYANAKNTTGVPGRIINTYNAAIDGQFLAPEQRQQFVAEAANIMRGQLDSQRDLEQQFTGLAQRKRINPQDVVLDFVGDLQLEDKNSGGSGRIVLGMDGRSMGGAKSDVQTVSGPAEQQAVDAPKVPNKPAPLPASSDLVEDGVWYQGPNGPVIRQNGAWMAPASTKNPAQPVSARERVKRNKS